MSLRRAVAVPFRQRGVDRLRESEFVVALSLDRGWFSPDQAEQLVDAAVAEGLVRREDDHVVVDLDPTSVSIPEDFQPDESVVQQRSTFERVIDRLANHGVDKQDAVAGVNRLQADLDLTVEAAAVLYARRQGLDVAGLAERAREEV